MAQSLFQMATQGKNVAAAIFWIKARGGWREKQEVQVSSAPLSQVSDDDLIKFITIAQQAIEEEEASGDGETAAECDT